MFTSGFALWDNAAKAVRAWFGRAPAAVKIPETVSSNLAPPGWSAGAPSGKWT
jgi:hypothetical protein